MARSSLVRAPASWRRALLLLAAGLAVAGPAAGQVGKVQVTPDTPEGWQAGPASRSACIETARIGGAIVVDPRSVDIVMRGGKRWRLTLAQQCPQLSYYGGFYYKPRQPGRFCAGRDYIMGRAGGACRVQSIAPLYRVPPPRPPKQPRRN